MGQGVGDVDGQMLWLAPGNLLLYADIKTKWKLRLAYSHACCGLCDMSCASV